MFNILTITVPFIRLGKPQMYSHTQISTRIHLTHWKWYNFFPIRSDCYWYLNWYDFENGVRCVQNVLLWTRIWIRFSVSSDHLGFPLLNWWLAEWSTIDGHRHIFSTSSNAFSYICKFQAGKKVISQKQCMMNIKNIFLLNIYIYIVSVCEYSLNKWIRMHEMESQSQISMKKNIKKIYF